MKYKEIGIIALSVIFFVSSSCYAANNFTAKNVHSNTKTSTSESSQTKVETAKKEVQPEQKKEEAAQVTAKTSELMPSNPTYYSDTNKALLNPNVRYKESPNANQGGFGLMREKRVHLKLDTDVNYDDNIFLTKEGKKTDVVSRISPGVYGYIGNDDYTVLGFYEADVLIYSKNHKETRVNQDFGGSVELFKQSRVKVSLRDTVRPTTDPATSEVAPFVKRIANDFGSSVRYDISPKTSASLDYGQATEYYISENYKQFNYIQHTVVPKFWYHITPKTSITGAYTLGITNYMGGADYNSVYHQGTAGIVGVLTPKSSIGLDAGYQWREYAADNTKNTGSFIMSGIYDYLWSPKTSIKLIVSSDINESVYSNVGYFQSYNFYGSVTHHILYNLDVSVNGLYIRSNYPHATPVTGMGEERRDDNLFGAGGMLQYRFRTWCSAYLGYDFKGNVSNLKIFNYNDNIVHGGVRLEF